MKRLLLFLFIAASAQLLYSQNQVPQNITGDWEGDVVEPGRSGDYHVSLSITAAGPGERAGSIWYPDYDCGGYLVYTGTNDGEIFIFREVLTTQGNCIDGGLVSVKFYNGTLLFLWSHKQYEHQAEGILVRE